MARPEGKLDVYAAKVARKVAVLVLGIDHVHLSAAAERSDQQRRQQVRLACPRIAEDADVGVRIAVLIERVDEHGRAARTVADDDQSAGLLDPGSRPREQRHERARIEDAPAGEAVDADRKGREMAIEHSEGAGLELA